MIENLIYLEQVYKVAQKTSINRYDMNAIGVAAPNTGEVIMSGIQRKVADVSENFLKRCEYITPEEDLILSSLTRNIPLEGMNMYMPWGMSEQGFRFAILFGVRKVVVHKKAMDFKKNRTFYRKLNRYLPQHGIEYVEFDGDIGCDFEFTVNGKTFVP